MNEGACIEMPKYRCHKEVWALKIGKLEVKDGSWYITPEDVGYAEFPVSLEYVMKHKPNVGGYYVVYLDGYQSFSPVTAFEDGYSKVEK